MKLPPIKMIQSLIEVELILIFIHIDLNDTTHTLS